MPLVGTLITMPLADLLQWVGSSRRTGMLQLELDKVVKEIHFRDGEIVGCSTDDPPERLGQYLIGRGRISERQLTQALAEQETSGKHLGAILVEKGALHAEELASHLSAKAEETILSLFDWPEARFRFHDGAGSVTQPLPVSLRVEEVLLRGLQRFDEMQRIRQELNDPAIVLRRTTSAPPQGLLDNPVARCVYESIDGERTIADVRLHVRGSEYLVYRCLFELLRSGHLEVGEIKPAPAGEVAGGGGSGSEPPAPLVLTEPEDTDRPAEDASPAPPAGPSRVSRSASDGTSAATSNLDRKLQRARRAMARGDVDDALAILDALYAEFPGDDALRRLTLEAEVAFTEKAYRHYLPTLHLVHLARPIEELTGRSFSPKEFFLISRIDGTWDVKSIVQLAPLREVDTLRTLKHLRETGVIELRNPPGTG